ncbi:DUF3325 family protein [Zavarzinia aquatilis]|uniref:DUF3325 domain-containing protein n=1 Tax=Zavarzinia aquatilis TaxID=2211142 RepID=A0A317EEI6_9PROT|nr:DUF3325 family protein [Zavarzinia aquatilis]PWR25458.1 DUF3325 domain-containing protein [Zavarzinia aquatilis]
MTGALLFALCLSGFLLLALSMDRHRAEITRHRLRPKVSTGVRLVGFACLALAFAISLEDGGRGLVGGIGLATAAALAVVLGLALRRAR